MAKRGFPEWIPGTSREFKARKRREAAAVARALDVLRLGCAYTPLGVRGSDFDAVCAAVDAWRKKLSANTWGR